MRVDVASHVSSPRLSIPTLRNTKFHQPRNTRDTHHHPSRHYFLPRYFSTLGRYTLSASPRGLVDALPSLRAPRSQLRFSSSAPSLILRRDKTFQAFDMQMRLHFLVTLSHRDEEAATGKVRGNFSVARGRLPAASSLRLLSH